MFDYHRQHGIGKCLAFLRILFPDFLGKVDESLPVANSFDVFNFPLYFSTEIRIARIFNTYGPRMNIDDGRVVSNFIAQALR
jgi:hypothetical protein